MKKLFFVLAAVLFTTLWPNTAAIAQEPAENILIETASPPAITIKGKVSNSGAKKDSISSSVLKHFKKTFQYARDVKWMPLKDGYMATFESDDFVERVYYHSSGNLCGTLKGYSADRLPDAIIEMIKKAYPKHSIVYADEVEVTTVPGAITYFVHVQLNQDLKIVRICEEDMDVFFDSEKSVNRF